MKTNAVICIVFFLYYKFLQPEIYAAHSEEFWVLAGICFGVWGVGWELVDIRKDLK